MLFLRFQEKLHNHKQNFPNKSKTLGTLIMNRSTESFPSSLIFVSFGFVTLIIAESFVKKL